MSSDCSDRSERHRLPAVLLTLLIGGIAAASVRPAGAALDPADFNRAIGELRRESRGKLRVATHRSTGAARFLTVVPGPGDDPRLLRLGPAADQALGVEARAAGFLAEHGKLFGIVDPAAQLALVEVIDAAREELGGTRLTYEQRHRGVPVFAAELRLHFGARGELVAANGTFVPAIAVDPTPRLDAGRAGEIAVEVVRRLDPPVPGRRSLAVRGATLQVFRAGLVQGVPGPDHLVWEVEVGSRRGARELVYVDAHNGKVVDRISRNPDVLRREVYNRGFGAGFKVWEEGQALPFSGSGSPADDGEINHIIEYTADSYDFFASITGGEYLSWDGSSAIMAAVFNTPDLDCPNASWNGRTTNFCPGTTNDDIVAHEWAHAYTETTHGLIYQWQPGALNEAYSDIFGEVVDLINGAGLDQPAPRRLNNTCSNQAGGSEDSVKWLLGEPGPIRDMWHPNCLNDPGKVSDGNYACSLGDNGGVHTNSGVVNHAFALLVDGGSFNGQTTFPIGLRKAVHIYRRAMFNYQVQASDFADHADALEQSCRDLIGVDLRDLATGQPSGEAIAPTDCDTLARVIAGVELRRAPSQCNFLPLLLSPAPALCTPGTPVPFFTDAFETGAPGWLRSNSGVYAEYEPRDWGLVTRLPDGRAGTGFFALNSFTLGDCLPGSDDQSGVMRLESPPIVIPAEATAPRLAFDHYVATEAFYDGGNLKLSVNGNPFELVPRSDYRFNPPNGTLEVVQNDNPLAGEQAFTGSDGGSVGGSWVTSQVNLDQAHPGDTVRLRFDFGVDGCNGIDGWYLDNLTVYRCSTAQPQPCVAGPGTLCLMNRRYKLEVAWENQFSGRRGTGIALPQTDLTGFFAFDDAANVELIVKMIDFGTVVKLFYGQLTNLRFVMTVTDTTTGLVKTYGNTTGECGAIDQAAFPKVVTAPALACSASGDRLCLLGNRFQVEVDWRNQFNGAAGRGLAQPLTDLSGRFAFDNPANVELVTKALDFGDRILFLYGALSDLEYTIRVTDTATGEVKLYGNPAGRFCGGIDNDF